MSPTRRHWRLYCIRNGLDPVEGRPITKEEPMEYREARSMAEVNALAEEGWELHSREENNNGVIYLMQRKRGPAEKKKVSASDK